MENQNQQKAKLEKFKSMGIPVPLEKSSFEQPVVNVKDPKMLSRIQEIRSGAKKGEFNAILSSGEKKNSFSPIPETKTKTNNQQTGQKTVKAPELASFAPAKTLSELSLAASLFDDTPSAPVPVTGRGQGSRIAENASHDSMGSDFLREMRSRIQTKASAGTLAASPAKSGFGFTEGGYGLNEAQNGMEAKIESVAANVAKKVAAETLKTFLEEYLSKKTSLGEGAKNTFKKVKDDIVLIEGKYYKLVPVKVKSK